MVTNEFATPGGRFYITSYGNGWAYEVEQVHTGHTLFFQDDDACTLKRESSDFMDDGHLALLFECLAYEVAAESSFLCEFDVDRDATSSSEYWA